MKKLISPLCFAFIGLLHHLGHAELSITCGDVDNYACQSHSPIGPAGNHANKKLTQKTLTAPPASGSGTIYNANKTTSVQNAQENGHFAGEFKQASPLPQVPYEAPHVPQGILPKLDSPTYPTTSTIATPTSTVSACHLEARSVGIYHFKYQEARASDLVWSGYGKKDDPKYLVHKSAKPALVQMVNDAKKAGINLQPSSIFRSVSRQQQIINQKRQTQRPEQIYAVSSPAGYSEHHTGLAVDFNSISNAFDESKAYHWLAKNAHRYGFEQTFTPEYSAWSGVVEESWHWRYIGKNGEFDPIFQKSRMRQCD